MTKNTPSRTTVRNRINRDLPEGNYFFPEVPVDEMLDACKAHGGMPVQEDGTEWNGMLVGRKGRATIEITFPHMKSMYLHIVWEQIESNVTPTGYRWESIHYVS